MGFKPFSKGQKPSKDGKQPFEPTEGEQKLIGKFGEADRTSFAEVKEAIAGAEVSESRRDPLWEAIRNSRTNYEAHRSGGSERGR